MIKIVAVLARYLEIAFLTETKLLETYLEKILGVGLCPVLKLDTSDFPKGTAHSFPVKLACAQTAT